MSDIAKALMKRLDKTLELLRGSNASSYGGAVTNRRMINAVADLRYQLNETGHIDILKAGQLFSGTGAMQEIALENDWGAEFAQLSKDVNRLLNQFAALEKVA